MVEPSMSLWAKFRSGLADVFSVSSSRSGLGTSFSRKAAGGWDISGSVSSGINNGLPYLQVQYSASREGVRLMGADTLQGLPRPGLRFRLPRAEPNPVPLLVAAGFGGIALAIILESLATA